MQLDWNRQREFHHVLGIHFSEYERSGRINYSSNSTSAVIFSRTRSPT